MLIKFLINRDGEWNIYNTIRKEEVEERNRSYKISEKTKQIIEASKGHPNCD